MTVAVTRNGYTTCPDCGGRMAKHAYRCRSCSPLIRGEQHYGWKGNNVDDTTKRERARHVLPSLGFCEKCGDRATDRFRRDGSLDNYSPENIGQLCRHCLMEWDGRLSSLIEQSSRAALSKVLRGENVVCPICKTEFYVKPSQSPRRKYCSFSCRNEAHRDPKLIRQLKRSARHVPGWSVSAKGETCCRNCGSIQSLHLHHIIPRGRWRAGRTDLRNGVTLCQACHFGWHHRNVEIPRAILTTDELAFVLEAQIGEDVEFWLERHYA